MDSKRKNKKQQEQESSSPSFSLNFSKFIGDDNKELDKNDYYYQAMELLGGESKDIKDALKLLKLALVMDRDYIQTYIGFVAAYSVTGEIEKYEESIKIAFDKTRKKFPKWPKIMRWGELHNRAPMRAIQYRAELYWDDKEYENAIELFRLLLTLNPGDNQGVRYEIAGLYAGLTGGDVNKMFDEGNEKQNWDKQEKLVYEQNLKHKFWIAPKDE